MQRPTKGRVVFFHSEYPTGGRKEGTPIVAIVADVEESGLADDNILHLHLVDRFTGLSFKTVQESNQGEAPGQWKWPPRE